MKAPDGTVIGETTDNFDGTFSTPISPANKNGEVLTVIPNDD
ncbi:Ig-like domain-containing protein, partial [Enterobacter mori]